MGWNKITIDTLTSAEDMISYELTELGATGVEVEDHCLLYTSIKSQEKENRNDS